MLSLRSALFLMIAAIARAQTAPAHPAAEPSYAGPATATTLSGIVANAAPVPSRLVNLSVESQISALGTALTVGVTITGTDPKTLLVRGIGPTLAAFGVPNALATPRLRLFNSGGALITTVTSWGDDQLLALAFVQTGAFPLLPGSADAALLYSSPPGGYSAQVDGGGYGTGAVLAEFYDADPNVATSNSRLQNLSARAVVSSTSPLTAGFVVAPSTGETILLRAVGPSLYTYGIRGYLAQPVLTLFDSTGTVVMSNAGWGNDPNLAAAFAAVGAFSLIANSADSAMRLFLAPGRYTAQVTSADGGSGLAMVEIYESP